MGNIPTMTIDELIDKLARPTYVLRMARANKYTKNVVMKKSAETRASNARQEIDEIVRDWFFDNYGSEIDGG